jgi:hypothetical protein
LRSQRLNEVDGEPVIANRDVAEILEAAEGILDEIRSAVLLLVVADGDAKPYLNRWAGVRTPLQICPRFSVSPSRLSASMLAFSKERV